MRMPASRWTATIGVVVILAAAAAGYYFRGMRHDGASAAAVKPKTPVVAAAPARYLGVAAQRLGVFDKEAQVHANLATYYLSFGRTFPVGPVRFNASAHAVTLIEILPRGVSLTDIASGRYDTWLRYVRNQIARSGDLVMLSFAPEGNGNWYSWGWKQSKPTDYIAAYQHAHKVIGNKSVLWVWQISPYRTRGFNTKNPRLIWPGNDNVDIVGLDGYFYSPGATFNGVFGRTIHFVHQFTGRPVLIAETAVGPLTGHETEGITQLFRDVAAWHLLGLVWFDRAQHSPPFHQDWTVTRTPAVQQAFRAAAASYMKAKP